MAKKKKNLLLYILLGVAVLLIAIVAIQSRNKPRGEKVAIEKPAYRTIKETVSASGKVFPEIEVSISSDVSGEVVELFIEEGDSVKAGQILARVDPEAYQSQVERGRASVNNARAQEANSQAGIERARAQVTQAEAQLEQVQAQLVNQREVHRRNVGLHKDGIISDADFEASQSTLDGMEANLRSLAASLESSKANLESAKQSARAAKYNINSAQASLKELNTTLRRTTIYAPNDGVVSQLNVEKGERVVGTSMMSGTEMLRIANLDAIEVQVDVSENDILRVSEGDPVKIEVDAYLDNEFTGYVTEIANSATGAGTSAALTSDQVINFVVKIRINPDSYRDLIKKHNRFPFRPGMSASVDITTEIEENVLTVPIQSVTTREKEDKKMKRKVKNKPGDDKKEDEPEVMEVIFLIKADTADMLEVKTGIQDDNYIQITSALDTSVQVVNGPYSAISKNLEEGEKVQIVKEKDLYGGGD